MRVAPVMPAALMVLAAVLVARFNVSTPVILNAPVVAVRPLIVALSASVPELSEITSLAFRLDPMM